jgi:hypothetical protein
VVSTIVGGEPAVGMLRIAHNTVEIDYRVQVAGRTNPRVHRLPVSLAQRAWYVIGTDVIGTDCLPQMAQIAYAP